MICRMISFYRANGIVIIMTISLRADSAYYTGADILINLHYAYHIAINII